MQYRMCTVAVSVY